MTNLFSLAASTASDKEAAGVIALLLGFGIIMAIGAFFALVSYFIASKLLARADGGLGKAFVTWLAHVLILIGLGFVMGMLNLVPKDTTDMSQNSAFAWGTSAVYFLLCAAAAAGVHKFSIVRGILFMIIATALTTGMMYGVSLVMVNKFSEMAKERKAKKEKALEEGAAIENSVPVFATEADAQAAALARYPELGVAGSPFNTAFLQKHKDAQANRPDLLRSPGWPMVLADEVALSLKK
jgi:hypothetical protein